MWRNACGIRQLIAEINSEMKRAMSKIGAMHPVDPAKDMILEGF